MPIRISIRSAVFFLWQTWTNYFEQGKWLSVNTSTHKWCTKIMINNGQTDLFLKPFAQHTMNTQPTWNAFAKPYVLQICSRVLDCSNMLLKLVYICTHMCTYGHYHVRGYDFCMWFWNFFAEATGTVNDGCDVMLDILYLPGSSSETEAGKMLNVEYRMASW